MPDTALTESASRATLSRTGLVLLALLTVAWGVNWPLIKLALSEVPELTFRALCCIAGALGLFLIARAASLRLRPPAGAWPWLIAAAFFNITVWNVLLVYGIGTVASGRAAILGYTMPLWGVIMSALVLDERLGLRRGFGLVLGMSGMALLMGTDIVRLQGAPLGALLIVGAAVSWAAGTVVLKRARIDMPTTVLTAWQLAIGGLPIVIGALALDGGRWGPVSLGPGLALAYNMGVSFVFCYWAWFRIVAEASVAVASISTLMVPVVGVFAGALILDEAVGWQELTALALVATALATVLRPATGPRAG